MRSLSRAGCLRRSLVKPGAKVAVDGVVEDGDSHIDESMVTGESLPVHKAPGDTVIGATLNTTGTLRIRATKVGADTALAQIDRELSNNGDGALRDVGEAGRIVGSGVDTSTVRNGNAEHGGEDRYLNREIAAVVTADSPPFRTRRHRRAKDSLNGSGTWQISPRGLRK